MIGLGLNSDLGALSVKPTAARGHLDLMELSIFCRSAGSARPLKDLAEELLGRRVQHKKGRHSARCQTSPGVSWPETVKYMLFYTLEGIEVHWLNKVYAAFWRGSGLMRCHSAPAVECKTY